MKAAQGGVRGGLLQPYFCLAAIAYVLAGVVASTWLAPRVPYADAWRHYARLLTQPFPASVLAVDNGHPEIFANLVRLADLRWFAGTEYVQIAIALGMALATFALLSRVLLRAVQVDPTARAAALLALALGVFWLANERALAHANDGLHVYCVLFLLAAMIGLLVRDDGAITPARVLFACALCLGAALNFGSGVAAFVALGALLFVRRAAGWAYAMAGAALALTLALYWVLKEGQSIPLAFHPADQFVFALSQLAAPLQYLVWPFVDPFVAAQVPAPLGAFALACARAWQHVFGDVHTSVLPQSLCGAMFAIWLVLVTLRARRASNEMVRLGLALAWFGVGVSGAIALSRADYFVQYPTQLYAPRYLPWSTLAWSGMLIAVLGSASTRRLVIGVAVAVSLLALPAEIGMTRIMQHQREVADDVALAAVVGAWPDRGAAGEVDPVDTRAGAEALRRYAIGPFAWPEAALIGRAISVDAQPVAAADIRTVAVNNGINTDARRVEVALPAPACTHARLLLVDQALVVGLLREVGPRQWRGAALGTSQTLQIFAPGCE